MKSKYNQGDIVQYTYNDGNRDLLVIIEVFEVLGSLRYLVHWLADNAKGRCKINTLDDNLSVTLLARGQQ
jgi:hypothetical protein